MSRLLCLASLVACTGGGSHRGDPVLEGECDPSGDAIATTPATNVDVGCFVGSLDITVVDDVAQWNALFDCPTPLPPGFDLATHRAAVVDVQCTPIDLRFATESAAEMVVGVTTHVSGACLDNVLVVPMPRSSKPIRLAECHEGCFDCPPVP